MERKKKERKFKWKDEGKKKERKKENKYIFPCAKNKIDDLYLFLLSNLTTLEMVESEKNPFRT